MLTPTEEKELKKAEALKDIDEYGGIEQFAKSAGGKKIIENTKKGVIGVIEKLVSGYQTLTHLEMIAICAELSEKIYMFRTLTRAGKNKTDAREALSELLKE